MALFEISGGKINIYLGYSLLILQISLFIPQKYSIFLIYQTCGESKVNFTM